MRAMISDSTNGRNASHLLEGAARPEEIHNAVGLMNLLEPSDDEAGRCAVGR